MSKLIRKGTHICPVKFHNAVKRLRNFFDKKGYVEVHSQNRLSILAACEDPFTISSFMYGGKIWPLPQTGQMWLEHELLKNPSLPGLYSVGTSYRNEPNPVPGRHDMIFPMFEFEMHGDINELSELESELCHDLGFASFEKMHSSASMTRHGYPKATYEDMCKKYNTSDLDHDHEAQLYKDFGPVFFLTDFPEHTSPFWNMARDEDGTSRKIDVIINGVETIGSAERSCDVNEMREQFYTISDGAYAKTLFSKFTKHRVENELEEFLSLDFFPRSGGGIGLTRLINALDQDREL